MTRTSRLLTLLSLLQTRREWPGALLAERLGISPRTIRRDVERLREMGYRVEAAKGPDGGYRLEAGSELPPLLFDTDQVVALGVALRTAAIGGSEIGESALRALSTVRQVLPESLRRRLDSIDATALQPVGEATPRSVDTQLLLAVSAAIRDRVVLRFDYEGTTDDRDAGRPRQIEPHHLVASAGRWYLVGWDDDRADWRVFRVDRMTPRSHTGRPFTPRILPGGDVREFVTAWFRGSVSGSEWPCLGEAVLDIAAEQVRPFIGDGSVESLGENRCLVRAGSWSWVALASALARFDAPLVSAEPAQLRDAFGVLSARFAAVSEAH